MAATTTTTNERKLVKVLLVFGVNVRQMKGKRPALAAENEVIRSSAALLLLPSSVTAAAVRRNLLRCLTSLNDIAAWFRST